MQYSYNHKSHLQNIKALAGIEEEIQLSLNIPSSLKF